MYHNHNQQDLNEIIVKSSASPMGLWFRCLEGSIGFIVNTKFIKNEFAFRHQASKLSKCLGKARGSTKF